VSYLLDTNFVSEWVKPRPDPGVVTWLTTVDEEALYLSVATLAELRYGVARLASSGRRSRLDRWLREELSERFAGRILPVNERIALAWGEVRAERDKSGRPISAMDALIAGTALVHGLTLVTRNRGDFDGSVSELLDPWTRP